MFNIIIVTSKQEADRMERSVNQLNNLSHHTHTLSQFTTSLLESITCINGEVRDFYKTSWSIEFEALSRMVKVRGSWDKPFKRFRDRKKLTFEHPQGTEIRDVIEL